MECAAEAKGMEEEKSLQMKKSWAKKREGWDGKGNDRKIKKGEGKEGGGGELGK